MEPWELIALLLAGAVGVGTLAKNSAAQAAAATGLSSEDADLLNRALHAALTTETDVRTLGAFSVKLRLAGFSSYADAIDQRMQYVSQMLTSHQSLAQHITFIKAAL